VSGSVPPSSIAAFVAGYENDRTLRGWRCGACGAVTATWGLACSRCGAQRLEGTRLEPTGTIVAGTVVAVASDEFVNDAPYGYVLVDVDGGGRLSGWVPGVREAREIRAGRRVRFRPSYKPGIQFELLEPGP